MRLSVKNHKLLSDKKPVEFIKSSYVGGALPQPTKILVMHFTYGATGRSSAEWFRSSENPGSSAHVVVDRDGSVIQCVPFETVAWHAGKSRWKDLVGLNNSALSIEMANWGYLRPSGDRWVSYTGVKISNPFIAAHKNGNPDGSHSPIGWEPYPARQFSTAVAIARTFVAEYGVTEVVGHDDIAPDRKWDPGPAFDMMRFRALVFGGRGDNGDIRMKVLSPDGLNLRTGPGTEFATMQLLPEGSIVEPMQRHGTWLSVSVIGSSGQPTATGWVHSRYLGDV
jgi:N-acetylmuramoyl-L-alanine amidase